MIKLRFCIYMFFLSALTYAQNWQQAGAGFNVQTTSLYADTAVNVLYCMGGFSQAETTPVNGCAQWNGINWDSITHINSIGAGTAARFNGSLYVAGYSDYILRWNGIQIDTVGQTAPGGVATLKVLNNELYALGGFDSIDGIPAARIAKYDGTNWSAIDTTHWIGGIMNNAEFYQGNLYVSGNFINYNGTIDRLAVWDGTVWNAVGGNALAGGLGAVNCFAAYNGDLWIGGLFSQSMGNPYNGIARWNGSQWLDPGGGIDYPSQVTDMVVFNNQLWIAGNFSTVAALPAQFISRWDGTNWCGLGNTFYPGGISAIEIFNNELYIAGGFKTIDADTFNYIAKWNGANFSDTCGNTTGIKEISTGLNCTVFPNPGNDQITFRFLKPGLLRSIKMYDATGREMWNYTGTETVVVFPAADFDAGVYYYQIYLQDNSYYSGKLVINSN